MDQNSYTNYSNNNITNSLGVATNSSDAICISIAMKFNDATVIVSVIILGLINVIVIAGNILVIVSVFISSKLRTVTNFFIVSLAVADLLVGIAVLPYSLTNEILDAWIFGRMWCQGWLVVDVWMCTASSECFKYVNAFTFRVITFTVMTVLNLCAISVDRYLAVTRPVRYRSIMTAKRAKMLIAAVWVLSFIICFPPLIGWNNDTPVFMHTRNNVRNSPVELPMSTQLANMLSQHSSQQSISSDGNVSSIGENDNERTIPREWSRFRGITGINNTYGTTNSNISDNSQCEYVNASKCSLFDDKGYVIYSALGSFYIPMLVMIMLYWRIYLVASRASRALKRGYKTTKSTNGSNEERLTLRIHRGYLVEEVQTNAQSAHQCNDSTNTTAFTTASTSPKPRSGVTRQTISESHVSDKQSTSKCAVSGHEPKRKSGKRQMPITLYRSSRLTANLTPNNTQQNGGNRRMSPSSQSTLSLPSSTSPCSSREGSARSAKLAMTRFSKRTSKYQAKRFHAETKAAKTVGIIVGGFILCWLPFFTVYLTRAFCVRTDCIPDLLFSIFVWLGYCNSMINPCIYGLFSRDFRRAFKNILCRCKFREETVSSLIRQIHMPTFFEDMPEDTVKTESQED